MAVLPLGNRCTELIAGTGRVTLSRTGGGADFGAYALLYTTRPVDGGVEAIVAATRPEDTDPAWNLAEPHRYGPQASETRPLMAWAAALNEAKTNDRGNGYTERLARALLTTGWSTRIVPRPARSICRWPPGRSRASTSSRSITPDTPPSASAA